MAEGTRLRELSDNLKTIEERVVKLTSDNAERVEERLQQLGTDCNQRFSIITQQIEAIQRESNQKFEAMQIETAKRFELMIQESNRRHELLSNRCQTQPEPPSSMPSSDLASGSTPLHNRGGKGTTGDHLGGLPTRGIGFDRVKGILQTPFRQAERWEEQPMRTNYHLPYPKLEFSIFGGEDP